MIKDVHGGYVDELGRVRKRMCRLPCAEWSIVIRDPERIERAGERQQPKREPQKRFALLVVAERVSGRYGGTIRASLLRRPQERFRTADDLTAEACDPGRRRTDPSNECADATVVE